MRQWQAHALKDRCSPQAQAAVALKGETGGQGLRCSQTHKVATCKDASRHSCTDSTAFCFSYRFLLSTLGQDGFCKISFLLLSLTLKTGSCMSHIAISPSENGERERNCHLLVVTKFWGPLEFIFKLMFMLNFKSQGFNSVFLLYWHPHSPLNSGSTCQPGIGGPVFSWISSSATSVFLSSLGMIQNLF